MRKINLRSQKGITLLILIATVVILSIENKILVYYDNNKTLPTKGDVLSIKSYLGGQATNRDGDTYHQIDMSKLNNITLNYGGGDINNKDIYVINDQSHEVYYLKGIIYDGDTYYAPF